MERIFLIGYMGAGKTTIGKELSRTLRVDFIDLDKYIQDTHQKVSINCLKKREKKDSETSKEKLYMKFLTFENMVISCGRRNIVSSITWR